MSTTVEVWSDSCVICEGRVFSGGNPSSDKHRCWECKSVLDELVSSNEAFHCTSYGCCPVTRLTRFHCLYCFIKKCLVAECATGCIWHQGLNNSGSFASEQNPSSEPVQIIAVEIDFGEKSTSHLVSSSDEAESVSSDADNGSSDDVCETICRVVFSHMRFCPTTAEKMRGLSLEPSPSTGVTIDDDEAAEEDEETLVPGSNTDSRRCDVFCKIADYMNSTVVSVAEFLRRLPGYERLSKDEKMNLLRGGFFKVWLLWSVPRFLSPSRQQLVLNENVSLSFSELSGVYSVEFVRGLFDFAHNWSSLGLNDAEVGLCAGIVLSTMSQTPGTAHIIQETNDLLKRALHQLLKQNYPTKPNLTEDVLQLISILDSISYSHNIFLQRFHNRWRDVGAMPLFAEVFNLPRTDETGNEIVPSMELGDKDTLRDEADMLENRVNKEVARSPSDLSNQAEDNESFSELGNLGDVSSSDLMSNVSNESEGELGSCGELLQSDLCTVEEILESELGKGGGIFEDAVNVDESVFSTELNEFNIFQRELLSQDEDLFQDKLSKDIFQRELSNDEIIFQNELIKDVVDIELSEDGDIFQSESRDS